MLDQDVFHRREQLKARVDEAKRTYENLSAELGDLDALLMRRVQEQRGGSTRVKLTSRRSRAAILRGERATNFGIQPGRKWVDFAAHHKSRADDDTHYAAPDLIARAFHVCGGGSDILKHLVTLWDNDPSIPYVEKNSARTKMARGFAVTDAITLLKMGLCTEDAVADVFNGCMDLNGKSLNQMRELAKTIFVPQTSVVRRGTRNVRQRKSLEELRVACRPLCTFDSKAFLNWYVDFRRRADYTKMVERLNRARIFYEMSLIRHLPDRDVDNENRINEVIRGQFPPLNDETVRAIGLGFLPVDHPARHRPSLARIIVQRLDMFLLPEVEFTRPGRAVQDRIEALLQAGDVALTSWSTSETYENQAIMRVYST